MGYFVRFIFTILITWIIPAVGLAVGAVVLRDLGLWPDVERLARDPLGALGGLGRAGFADCPGAGEDACRRAGRVLLMSAASLASAALATALILLFFLLGRLAGGSRWLNALIFPRATPLANFVIILLVVVHGAILSYAVYVGLDQFRPAMTWVEWLVVGFVGGGALAAGGSVARTVLRAGRPRAQGLLARPVGPLEAPELWRFVGDVARELKARPPKNVVVGLEPNFFATAAPVITPGRQAPLQGETLYLSLPLMRLFTTMELRAVVGHELGHFRGADTAYSMRFAPVYRALATTLEALTNDQGRAVSLSAAPSAAILRFLLETFGRNERTISRKREHAADMAGVKVSSAFSLASSLAKVAVYAPLWQKTRIDNLGRLNQGKVSRNLSRVYADSARFDVTTQLINEVVSHVLETRIAHPTDSHPPISDRYAAIGFDPTDLTIEDLTRQGLSAEALFKDLISVEEDLTVMEHQIMLATGHAQAPETAAEENHLLNSAYLLAATMVAADGSVAPEEVRLAEEIGGQMFEDFDPVTFREYFDALEELASFRNVATVLGQVLSDEHLRMVHAYLTEIAEVDEQVSPEERDLLIEAAAIWRIAPRAA